MARWLFRPPPPIRSRFSRLFHQEPPRRREPGFTLMEIVMIIAIMVILLVAGVGLLGGAGARARRAGADLLVGMIEQARAAAITTRSHVVLAVAEPGDLPAADQRCRLGLFKVDNWPDFATGPVSGVLMSRWRMLEDGAVLIGGGVGSRLANPLDGPELKIAYGTKGQTITVHAIAFNPRGGLHYPAGSHPVAMRIAEGGYRGGQAVPNRHAHSQTISESRIKIGRVTARPYQIDG